jgi:hypothetical protein
MSEIQNVNVGAAIVSVDDDTAAAAKKKMMIRVKKVKSKLLTTIKTKVDIEEDKEKGDFVDQLYRKDVLENVYTLAKRGLSPSKIYDMVLNDNKESTTNERRQGWIFETLIQCLVPLCCIENISYTEVCDGQLQNLKPLKNINRLLKVKVEGGGNNIVDMSLKKDDTLVLVSIKRNKKYSETDVSKIDNTVKTQNITDKYKIALFVKDKEVVMQHKYKNKLNIDKQIHDKIIQNGLLFDEKDVIKGLDVFCQRFSNMSSSIDEFIDFINAEYLLSPRQQLTKKLHQKMAELKFINSVLKDKHRMWCIAHKPRSGKSITILSICKYLLENGYKKILIMTSVPATISSFVNDLEKYIDFKNINYKQQDEFVGVDETFNGIVFCSVQYLKIDGKYNKKDVLKKMGFDAIITDESHQGSSTDKTKNEILNVDSDVEEIRKNIKLNIFASGTADKTKKYYGIHSSCVYEWEIEDEAFMKELIKPVVKNREDILDYMVRRHGTIFTECYEDETLNKDYSKHPTQVLMKHSIPDLLMKEISEYNAKHGTNFGYSCSSLFALKQDINEKGEVVYAEEFELCKTTDGIELLKGFFDCIISTQRMRKTVMKQIENIQTSRGSRKSTVENPLLFIVYLPTHTRNNTISLLQKTLKQFLETHKLWCDYNIEYSNSIENTGNAKEEYNEYIQTIMNKTKTDNKKGCILLLGNKGSVGITYKECDVTISLDDGHHLDNQKQRYSRALTEAEGKTIGINVDMNIQRTYLYLIDIIQKHRKNMKSTKSTKTNAEILYYLFEHNIFLFDPQEINNGKMTTVEIMSYFKMEVENIMKNIDDTCLLENLECNDDMHDILTKMVVDMKKQQKQINKDLEGNQQDCPKGDKVAFEVDAPAAAAAAAHVEDTDTSQHEEIELSETEKILINRTLELCKYIFPYLAMISKSYKIFDFKEILTNEKTKGLIISFLEYKKIEKPKDNYNMIIDIMSSIIDENDEIVNNIREIYSIAPAKKLRELLEKHFISTIDEKKDNGEVPTPVTLVDVMLNRIPVEFWKTPQKVFEPCCGKGNFVLGVFDKFYKGLENMYPDETERCRVIMTECIYYADLTALNVFITTEIMKCHVQSYCGLDELDFEFNHYTGDTLELDIEDKWNIRGVNGVCMNAPYNSSGDTATGNTIWQDFTKNALNKWLLPGGYLLCVHPPGWRKPNTERGRFTKMFDLMTKQNQMLHLEIHGIKDGQKVFKCGTRYDWYLIEKTSQYKNTTIVDEDGIESEINLSELSWLPNSNVLEIKKILAKNDGERCPIMQSMSAYEPRKKWMSSKETDEFKYPCIHSTPKSGVRYMYSSVNDRGHFGVSKVIFGDSGIYKPVIDMEGKYGMTQHSMAIQVDNLDEAMNISKVIESPNFDKIIQSCLYSSYAIDWNIFKEFKKDFWKEFI